MKKEAIGWEKKRVLKKVKTLTCPILFVEGSFLGGCSADACFRFSFPLFVCSVQTIKLPIGSFSWLFCSKQKS